MWENRVDEFIGINNWLQDNDWLTTESLKNEVLNYRNQNPNGGLNREIFTQIVQWKLRNQIHRVQHHLDKNTDQLIREITALTFRISHANDEVLTKVRIRLLASMPGIEIGLASAILTIYFPYSYGIIDFRVWDEINNCDPNQIPIKKTFTIGDYHHYLSIIRLFAQQRNIEVQKVDYALWKIWEIRRLNT